MRLNAKKGKPIDAAAIRAALLNTAIPCDPEVVEEPERCLRGKVNLPDAMNLLFGQSAVVVSLVDGQTWAAEQREQQNVVAGLVSALLPGNGEVGRQGESGQPAAMGASLPSTTIAPSALPSSLASGHPNCESSPRPSTITPSTAYSGHIYALGTLAYDFGNEARRDTFKQRMTSAEFEGVIVPPNPYDARQMVEHLDRNPDAGRSLIWLLQLDADTIYVLEPKGPFAAEIYEMFLLMLAGQLEPEPSNELIERVSIPARRTNRTVELFSGEVVPVATIHNVRGMYGWKVNALVEAALAAVLEAEGVEEAEETAVRQGLTAFLNRVYHDLHNVGQMSRDRALNFAATNIFQAASTFAEAIAHGRRLDTIEVEKSPYCRLNSDCWDIKLIFFDPENSHRARQVFRFTIDVADSVPVTIGKIKSWSILNR